MAKEIENDLAPDESATIHLDGVWRPEPWHNRFLVVRNVPVPDTNFARREIDGTGKFVRAHVYETEEAAQKRCDLLNEKEPTA